MSLFYKFASELHLRPLFSKWSPLFKEEYFFKEMGYDDFIKYLAKMPNVDLLLEEIEEELTFGEYLLLKLTVPENSRFPLNDLQKIEDATWNLKHTIEYAEVEYEDCPIMQRSLSLLRDQLANEKKALKEALNGCK